LTRAVKRLYVSTYRVIDWGTKISEKMKMYQGVKQGCSLSLMIFGLYLDERIKKWQKNIKDDLK
jgi:hypothetical protein